MNPVLLIRLAIALIENVVVDKVLRALCAEFEHDTHGSIRIDVRIVSL